MMESIRNLVLHRPTHYFATFGLARYDERVHIKVLRIAPPSRVRAWLFGEKQQLEEIALRVPYERIMHLHALISLQTETYFDRKLRRGFAKATRELEQFVQETRCSTAIVARS